MKSFLITIFFLSIGQVALSQDWIYVGSDIKNDKYYVKSNYVSKGESFGEENIIKIWIKRESKIGTVTKKGKTTKFPNVIVLLLYEYDCTGRKSKLIGYTMYNSKGVVIDSLKLPDYEQEWNDVVPESIGEALLDKVCKLFN